MAETPDAVVLSPPKIIGVRTVALAIGVTRGRVWELVKARDDRVMAGYLGKISGRHVWNAHELFAGMYTSPVALWEEISRVEHGTTATRWCAVDDCEQPAQFLRLCSHHLGLLMRTWRRSERSTLAQWRLLAMCQWVVERNAHLKTPDGWDPWSGICMTPGCSGRTDESPGRASPLCVPCSMKFWNHRA